MRFSDFCSPAIKWSLLIVLIMACFRLGTLGLPALVDPSEGRYATTALEMAHTGDWVTPYTYKLNQHVPFLGKPPLLFWSVASFIRIFGENEFVLRLPSFLASMGTCLIVGTFAYLVFSLETAILATLFLLSSLLFFFLAGACVADAILGLCVSGAIIGAALSLSSRRSPSKFWGYLFFVSCAVGFLTKGPVIIAVVGTTLVLWRLLAGGKLGFFKLPWIGGAVLFLLIVSPWYIMAEQAQPGFLRYFFVNENILRYVSADYGDRYGSGHRFPIGSAWLMLGVGFLPWTPMLVVLLLSKARRDELVRTTERHWLTLCLSWALATPIFFTGARQISATYLLPALPGLALILALLTERMIRGARQKLLNTLLRINWIAASVLCGVACLMGIIFHLGLAINIMSAVLCAAVVYFVPRLAIDKHGISIQTIGVSALACVSAFALVIANFSDVLAGYTSSRPMVEFLEHRDALPIVQAAFVKKIPHSAYYYLNEYEERNTIELSLIDTAQMFPTMFGSTIIRLRDFYKLTQSEQNNFVVKNRFGDWLLLDQARRFPMIAMYNREPPLLASTKPLLFASFH